MISFSASKGCARLFDFDDPRRVPISEEAKGRQCEMVYQMLCSGPRSTRELVALGVTCPTARISDLRKLGYCIVYDRVNRRHCLVR